MILIKRPNRKKHLKLKLKTKIKLSFLCIIVLLITILYTYIILFEKEVVPVAIKISEKYATNIVSQQINESVENVITDMNLHSSHFFKNDSIKNTNYLNVDTLLINNVCLKVSNELAKSMEELKNTKIELPIGIFSGVSAFSWIGPPFTIYVTSMGDAMVDYETKFESVGINQINVQIFLNIDTSVGIINPLYKKDMKISRKLMLVNTVYNGEVPNTYFNVDK